MDPFVGEIRLMPYGGGNLYSYIPRGWAPCVGQLLPISQNTALFSLLGIQYGGNGSTTFGLPDLRGRAIVGQGQGQGLTKYPQGAIVGTESVTLISTQMPQHAHSLGGGTGAIPVSTGLGNQNGAANGYFAANAAEQYGQAPSGNTKQMLSGNTTFVGGGQPHEDRMPFLTLNYFIALQGVFPQRQ